MYSGGLRVVVNRIRTDATTSAIWQHKKLKVLESRVSFSTPIFDADTYEGLDSISETAQMLAPLQAVKHGSGLHMLGIMDKQVKLAHDSLGWDDLARKGAAAAAVKRLALTDVPGKTILRLPPPVSSSSDAAEHIATPHIRDSEAVIDLA